MEWDGLYTFDAADAELSLMPMAVRRALDCTGLHLSLATWQTLPQAARRALLALGAAPEVDTAAVVQQLTAAGATTREQLALADPAADHAPHEVKDLLGSSAPRVLELWPQLRSLDRYVLAQLCRRAKRDRALEAASEIAAFHAAAVR